MNILTDCGAPKAYAYKVNVKQGAMRMAEDKDPKAGVNSTDDVPVKPPEEPTTPPANPQE